MRPSPFELFLGLLYAVAFVAIAHLAWEGALLLRTPLIDRPTVFRHLADDIAERIGLSKAKLVGEPLRLL